MINAAVIVAAGRGTRAAGAAGLPKQYARLAGRTVLAHTLQVFLDHPAIARIVVVRHADDEHLYVAAVGAAGPKLLPSVAGGATRQASVRAGLEALAGLGVDRVLIHDAARPFISGDVIDRVLGALDTAQGAIAAEPVADTLKKADDAGHVATTIDRKGLWRAQTPQGFALDAILGLHHKAAEDGRHDFTDDAALAEWAGLTIALVPGSSRNTKITTSEDLAMADRLMTDTAFEPRSGTGFDVHRFEPGDAVWLCGVQIPHEMKLQGHSDADVGLHALTDAVLGAIGDGDIGQHFPPSDPKWKGAASHQFLEDAARRVAERGGRIVNVDVTLLCEAPRVGPHRDAMRAAVAKMLGIDISRVGVKATTTEGLGFTGRREGIAAMASASVLLPVAQS